MNTGVRMALQPLDRVYVVHRSSLSDFLFLHLSKAFFGMIYADLARNALPFYVFEFKVFMAEIR